MADTLKNIFNRKGKYNVNYNLHNGDSFLITEFRHYVSCFFTIGRSENAKSKLNKTY